MKRFLLATLIFMLPVGASAARAQPRRHLVYGWGDKLVRVGELPPALRDELRKEVNQDLAIGFLYEHAFLFAEGFDFWTWNGRHVLFHGDTYWNLPDELLQVLTEGGASLSTPLAYRIPAGLTTVLVITAAIAVRVYFSAQARARRRLKDSKYQEALQLYRTQLPPSSELEREDKEKALAAAVEFLQQQHGISSQEAEANLRRLLVELDREHSYELRQQAVLHEQEGEWTQAIDLYTRAANLRIEADQKDYAFLLKCIARVRDKQARA